MQDALIAAIREAGRIMRGAHDAARTVTAKPGEANFVTAYDVAVQRFLFSRLGALYPDAAFVGEEDGADDVARLCRGRAFVIDPIDGTTNFMRGFGHSAVSVALCENGEVVLGAVYDPYTDELFYAERGRGARLLRAGESSALRVSGRPLSDGLILFGTSPYYADTRDGTFAAARILFDHALDIRRGGSAALDLCTIAAGRAEVFFEMRLSPWDYAAGMLLVREAGGTVTAPDGAPVPLERPSGILCGNPTAYTEAAALLRQL